MSTESPGPSRPHGLVVLFSVIGAIGTIASIWGIAHNAATTKNPTVEPSSTVGRPTDVSPPAIRQHTDPPANPPPADPAPDVIRQRDIEAIKAFRWKYQDAMQTLISLGDMTAMLNLSVSKLNPPPQESAEIQLKARPGIQVAAQATQPSFAINGWNIESLTDDGAYVHVESMLRAIDMGRPTAIPKTGTMRLAKVNGEWLLASGGIIH